MKACIDALEANFPTVARLVGSEWFRAAAALYVNAEAPRDGRLLHYGSGFADFLHSFEPAAELVYLPGVAQLDTLWREAHVAEDAPAADAAWVARQSPEQMAALSLRPHPAARWAWFDDQPVFSIWERNRARGEVTDELAWKGEGALADTAVRRRSVARAHAGRLRLSRCLRKWSHSPAGRGARNGRRCASRPCRHLCWPAERRRIHRPIFIARIQTKEHHEHESPGVRANRNWQQSRPARPLERRGRNAHARGDARCAGAGHARGCGGHLLLLGPHQGRRFSYADRQRLRTVPHRIQAAARSTRARGAPGGLCGASVPLAAGAGPVHTLLGAGVAGHDAGDPGLRLPGRMADASLMGGAHAVSGGPRRPGAFRWTTRWAFAERPCACVPLAVAQVGTASLRMSPCARRPSVRRRGLPPRLLIP